MEVPTAGIPAAEAPRVRVPTADEPKAAGRSPNLSGCDDRAGAPPVDAAEQEQPDHIDEVPVPGRRLKAEMALRREMAGAGAEPADDQEAGADDHVETVEPGGQEERRGVHPAAVELERRVGV